MFFRFFEHRLFSAEAGFQRHDDRLAQRVDRWIGDLSKLLAEKIVKHTALLREYGHGGVITHGTNRLLARLRQWTHHLITLFESGVVHLHVRLHFLRRQPVFSDVDSQAGFDTNGVFFQPIQVGLGIFELVVDIGGVMQLAGQRIHRQDLAGTKATFGYNIFWGITINTNFGRNRNSVVFGDHPTGGAQAVSVQRTYSVATIGDYQTGGAVPGLNMHRVVFVKRLEILIHGLHVLPRRWYQHADGFVQFHAAGQKHFQHIVETG